MSLVLLGSRSFAHNFHRLTPTYVFFTEVLSFKTKSNSLPQEGYPFGINHSLPMLTNTAIGPQKRESFTISCYKGGKVVCAERKSLNHSSFVRKDSLVMQNHLMRKGSHSSFLVRKRLSCEKMVFIISRSEKRSVCCEKRFSHLVVSEKTYIQTRISQHVVGENKGQSVVRTGFHNSSLVGKVVW